MNGYRTIVAGSRSSLHFVLAAKRFFSSELFLAQDDTPP